MFGVVVVFIWLKKFVKILCFIFDEGLGPLIEGQVPFVGPLVVGWEPLVDGLGSSISSGFVREDIFAPSNRKSSNEKLLFVELYG